MQSIDEIKQEHLQQQHKDLCKEYEDISHSLGFQLNPAGKLRIKREMEQKENEIREVEKQLGIAKVEEVSLVPVNVAVVAMKKQEAQQLIVDKTLGIQMESSPLYDLVDRLREFEIEDLPSCYETERHNWQPLLTEDGTAVFEILEKIVQQTNDYLAHEARPQIQINNLSEAFLSEKSSERDRAWDLFETQGGLVIVDALTLYHQPVLERLIESQLFGLNSPVGLVLISPLRTDKISIYQTLHLHMQHRLKRIYSHCVEKFDPFYELDVRNLHQFQRWLHSVLPNLPRRIMSPEARQNLQAQANHKPTGLSTFVIGGR
jgi:hypothetical protein